LAGLGVAASPIRAPDAWGAAEPAACHERVIVVLIDTLRRDHLGVYGYERPISPTLDLLARGGLFLSNQVASSSHTVPSTLSLLTSLLPSQHGLQYWTSTQGFSPEREHVFPRVPKDHHTLAEYFSEAGYTTAGVVSNPWLKRRFGFAQGFSRYLVFKSREGALINSAARQILAKHNDDKLFLYLHYMDVHVPYTGRERKPPAFPRPEKGELLPETNGPRPDLEPDDLALTQAHYDERIWYMDGLLDELVTYVSEHGLDCDTTWVVTSDHGDEFNEHGGLGHGTTVYNELINSFTVFWNPRRFAARRVDHYTHAVDVLPTLLEAHGIEPDEGVTGRSLHAPPGQAPPDYPETGFVAELAERKALIRGEWKLIVDRQQGTEVLYRVGPFGAIESEKMVAGDPKRRAVLRAELKARTRSSRAAEAPAPSVDPETQRELRELGYLEAIPPE
jgi:arylsulfatase A-like enzyme